MTDTSMSIRVLLFARYAELLGRSELTLEVPFGATVEEAISRVRALPGGVALPARLLVARGCDQVGYDTRLAARDELALLPPMAGG
ncbi:MAG TPA: MoaD/ThiS family protein [Gemmatimonadales bacterium]